MKKLYTSGGGASFLIFCTLLFIQLLISEAFAVGRVQEQKPAGHLKSTSSAVLPIVFVKSGAPGANDGSSWENAYWELAEALKYAHENPGVEQIWVANGTYYPRYDGDYIEQTGEGSSNSTFLLLPDIKIYGGFKGTEQTLAERKLNISAGNSVEAEDVNGPPASVLDGNGVVFHVVTSAGDVFGASLDGFVIRGGNANNGSAVSVNGRDIPQNVGGGIVLFNSAPSLSNLHITSNYALDGSGIYASESDFVLTNAIVNANSVDGKGAVYTLNSSAILTNNTISANTGQTSAALVLAGAAPKIRNTIISANLGTGAAVEVLDGTVPSFANSIVPGSGGSGSWNAAFGNNLGGNLDVNPALFDEGNGLLGLKPGSPAVNKGNNLYFQSGQNPDLSGITTDPRGTPRIIKNTVDIGALESVYGILSTTLTPNENGILFVKKGGSGSKNGHDWNNAAAEVADAVLASHLLNVRQIWVAGGIYHPLYRLDDFSNADPKSPLNSFLLTGDIQLYGGFKGTESSLAERNLRLKENASVLSGDFNQDDEFNFTDVSNNGIPNAFSENAHHLVYGMYLNTDRVMDGFTIEGANNTSSNVDDRLFILETKTPAAYGSGIFVYQTRQIAIFDRLIIRNNLGHVGGGFMGFEASSGIFNSAIYHNYDKGFGSAILDGRNIAGIGILNTTVAQNISEISESGMVGVAVLSIDGRLAAIYNSIITQNVRRGEGGPDQLNFFSNATASFSNSIVGGSGGSANWQLGSDEDQGGNLDIDPQFVDTEAGDFSLDQCSRAIDAGDLNGVAADVVSNTDLAGNNRIFNKQVDIGAFEFQGVRPPNAFALAGNAKTSSFTFSDDGPKVAHTFTVAGTVCDADLLTLIPGTNISGDVTAKVWVDAQVNSYAGAAYLQRHFDITPAENPESSSGRVVLYFTQAEFDALNAKLSPSDYLPTGQVEGEDGRKANLRIYQFHGESSDGSGSPSSYTDSRTVIDADDSDIRFNAALNRWEVTFSVEGFSGFFGGTAAQNPLPVRLISFEGKQTDDQKVKLDWKVAEQENIQMYEIEYSENGKTFSKIGEVSANILTSTAYTYTDSLTHTGDQAYYRLKILEFDGKTGYSKLISLKLLHNAGLVAYPVPARNELWLDWKKSNAGSVELIDSGGKVLRVIKKSSGVQKVDISGLTGGLFFLKTEGNAVLKVVKE
ncbi:choice-of-anchor Q domain-containing protein [Dyadobacter luticola]|uniref:T9SS type A sorting domain-containing protein n=1 Tax=Dyadobacter luticola TaxID=1979387 RepID=A0A5R9KWB0_9BACT|nr:choice-of-anchor Q domain-containing protein [Dyadobacter luticola]TLV00379.1 hypothetical protein FEN17_12865 [Dyadobacter luticola]